jgi:hypothetical protein
VGWCPQRTTVRGTIGSSIGGPAGSAVPPPSAINGSAKRPNSARDD